MAQKQTGDKPPFAVGDRAVVRPAEDCVDEFVLSLKGTEVEIERAAPPAYLARAEGHPVHFDVRESDLAKS